MKKKAKSDATKAKNAERMKVLDVKKTQAAAAMKHATAIENKNKLDLLKLMMSHGHNDCGRFLNQYAEETFGAKIATEPML